MEKKLTLAFTLLTALTLMACGDHSHEGINHGDMNSAKMDHSKMKSEKTTGDIGQTKGTILSISADGNEVTINHQKIESIGMGAMTMGFGVTSAVDLSNFSKYDPVSIMVKKGKDKGYLITTMCNTKTEGMDCLEAKIKQSSQ